MSDNEALVAAVWDACLPVLAQAFAAGTVNSPPPLPWAEQPADVRSWFVARAGDLLFDLQTLVYEGQR